MPIREKIRQRLIGNVTHLGHDILDIVEDLVYEKTETRRPKGKWIWAPDEVEEAAVEPNLKPDRVKPIPPSSEKISEDTEVEEEAPGPTKKVKDKVLY